jgi:hypothetical protein
MIYSEIYSTGKYDVLYANDKGQYPRRIGHIVGAKRSWLAEVTLNHLTPNLGYFKTKKAALLAIKCEFERPLTNSEAATFNNS